MIVVSGLFEFCGIGCILLVCIACTVRFPFRLYPRQISHSFYSIHELWICFSPSVLAKKGDRKSMPPHNPSLSLSLSLSRPNSREKWKSILSIEEGNRNNKGRGNRDRLFDENR